MNLNIMGGSASKINDNDQANGGILIGISSNTSQPTNVDEPTTSTQNESQPPPNNDSSGPAPSLFAFMTKSQTAPPADNQGGASLF